MKKLVCVIMAILLVAMTFTACGAPAATSSAPATEAPAQEAPATEAPKTEAPATEAPATDAPAAGDFAATLAGKGEGLKAVSYTHLDVYKRQEVHVKDGMDACISSKLIGEGNANVVGSIQYLKNTGYEGWLHFENYYWKRPRCDESDDVFQLLKRDVSILKNCWRT